MLLSQSMCRKKLANVYVGKEFNINILMKSYNWIVTKKNWIFFSLLWTALMYCSLDTLIGKLRGGEEDEFNSIGAATLTGMLFKSTAGVRPIAIAGALGGGLATAYHFGEKLWNSRGHSLSTPNWA